MIKARFAGEKERDQVMRRKGLIVFIAVLGLCVLVLSQYAGRGTDKPAGTSGNGKPAAPANDKNDPATERIVMRAAVSMQPAEFGRLQKYTAQYMKAHDGITVELQNLPPAESYTQMKKYGQLGNGPDVLLLNNAWVNEFAALGFLRPLDENFTVDQQALRVPAMLKQVKWNGYLWGVPKDIDPYILVWNKKTAAEAKFEHAPETAEEMLAWNKAFAKPEEGKFGIYFDIKDPMAFVALLSSLGPGGAEGMHPLQKLNDPAVLKNLQAFLAPQDPAWNGKTFAKNNPAAGAAFSPWDPFEKGKLAAILTTVSEFRRHRGADSVMSAIPLTVPGSWLKGRSYSVSSHSKHPIEALNWMKEMTSQDVMAMNWTESGYLPALSLLYTMPPLIGDELYASYSWLVREGKVLPLELDGARKLDNLSAELSKLHNGEQDLKTFADKVSKNNPAK
jgi:maltose-binding protein MalE